MKTFVIGDIHGAYRALIQCLERSSFHPEKDRLIVLGDICDGWPEVHQVINYLSAIPNLVLLRGNHDEWALQWMKNGEAPPFWRSQGGDATMQSFPEGVPENAIQFLDRAHYYFEEEGMLFVHAGIRPDIPLEQQYPEIFLWDRNLVLTAVQSLDQDNGGRLTSYKEIYVGHTPTINFGIPVPFKACEIWLMDTGAGWEGGRLSMMNVTTGEIFQSEMVDTLYPGIAGR